MKLWDFTASVDNRRRNHPDQRMGQVTFNVAYECFGSKINSAISTNIDPFFDDDNLPRFYSYLLEKKLLTTE